MTDGSGWRFDLRGPIISAVFLAAAMQWVGDNGYRQDLLVLSATYAFIALGMYIPFIMGGLLSAAYNAYAAVGAYAVGIIAESTELPLPIAWVAGALISALLATALGLVTRRLSGFYLAAVTLLFGSAFQSWLTSAQSVTGGAA